MKTEKRSTSTLRGVANVTGDLQAVNVRSVTDAMTCLRNARAVTTAGDRGAMTVWRDDYGNLRCEFNRYKATLSAVTAPNMKAVRTWLKEWWPQLGRD